MNLRDSILNAQDLKREAVAVPEWGVEVFVRAMTGTERDAFEQSLAGDGRTRDLANLRARLLVRTLVDESGNRLFADAEDALLGGKSAAALDRCFEVAQRLNGIGAEQEAIAKN